MPKLQPIKAIVALCNPFLETCWADIETPITPEEIMDAAYGLPIVSGARGAHIKKIVEFFVRGWKNPIQIDVGVPALGCKPEWPVTDGNHRLAAAILRKSKTILAEISGDTQHATKLGLNP